MADQLAFHQEHKGRYNDTVVGAYGLVGRDLPLIVIRRVIENSKVNDYFISLKVWSFGLDNDNLTLPNEKVKGMYAAAQQHIGHD